MQIWFRNESSGESEAGRPDRACQLQPGQLQPDQPQPRPLAAWVALSALLILGALPAAGTEAADRQEALIQRGLENVVQGKFDRAVGAFEEAERVAGSPCGECRLGLAIVYGRMDELKKAEKAARSATGLLRGHESEATAHLELGKVCLQRGERKAALYADAESAFRRSLELSEGQSPDALFYLGATLLKREQNEEGLAKLRDYLERYPDHRHVATASSLVDNPLRATKNLVPGFELKTLDRTMISNADIEGKVVLLDFWATWCAPCRKAVPTLRAIAARHEDDPFVLISLSVDRDELLVRDFVKDNGMEWTQVWDRGGWGQAALQVSKYPTYLLIGPDGEILHRISGGGAGIEDDLKRRVAKAVRKAKKRS